MIVSINSQARFELIKRTIKLLTRIVLSSRVTVQILVIYFNKLLEDRDLLFESQCLLFLKYINKVYAYIIDIFFREVQVRNDID